MVSARLIANCDMKDDVMKIIVSFVPCQCMVPVIEEKSSLASVSGCVTIFFTICISELDPDRR